MKITHKRADNNPMMYPHWSTVETNSFHYDVENRQGVAIKRMDDVKTVRALGYEIDIEEYIDLNPDEIDEFIKVLTMIKGWIDDPDTQGEETGE